VEPFTLALLIIVVICPIFLIATYFYAEWEADDLEKHLEKRWDEYKKRNEE